MTTLDEEQNGTAATEIADELHSAETDPGSNELHVELHDELHDELHEELHDELHGELHDEWHDELHDKLREELPAGPGFAHRWAAYAAAHPNSKRART